MKETISFKLRFTVFFFSLLTAQTAYSQPTRNRSNKCWCLATHSKQPNSQAVKEEKNNQLNIDLRP